MGAKDGKHNNSEDGALFRATVGDAAPVKNKDRHQDSTTIKPVARKRREQERHGHMSAPDPADLSYVTLSEETGDTLWFKRVSVNNSTMKKLRRGQIRIEEEIDLHGMTAAKAQGYLKQFIRDCRQENCRCIRVVHGKGLSSGPAGPVIKHGVNNWLRQWDEIIAFCSARPCDGGTGAVYVLLRK